MTAPVPLREEPEILKADRERPLELPHNVEVEQALLGALLRRPIEVYDAISLTGIEPYHFFGPEHCAIYEVAQRMLDRGRSVTPEALFPALKGDGGLGELGVDYLHDLAANVVTLVNVGDYAETVIDLWRRRELILRMNEATFALYDLSDIDVTAAQIGEQVGDALIEVTAEHGDLSGGVVTLERAVADQLTAYERAAQDPDASIGLMTGLHDFDRILDGFENGRLYIVAARPAMGKAQPLDAPVLLANGRFKPIGGLAVGEALASVDGAPSRVEGVYPQGRKPIYRVTFSDGRSTRCCGEHLWRVQHRKWREPRVMQTHDVLSLLNNPNNRNRLWIDKPSGHFGADEGLPLDPWLLGVLIGDGSLSGQSIMLSTPDAQILHRVMETVGDVQRVRYGGGYDFRITQERRGLGATDTMQALRSLGLAGKGSHQRFIPEQYLAGSRETRLEVLRGLIDTDGWAEKHNCLRFATSSERLAHDVQSLVRSLGGLCDIRRRGAFYTRDGERCKARDSFVCKIRHVDPREFCTLHKKRLRLERFKGEPRLTFTSIEPEGEADAVCIAVTHSSRLYITDDYTVTHNTVFAQAITSRLAAASGDGWGLLFNLEMSAGQLAGRAIAAAGKMDVRPARRGRMAGADWDRMMAAAESLAGSRVIIDARDTQTLASIERVSRQQMRKRRLACIVVDYLQLVTASAQARRYGNRVNEVSEMTRELKKLAKRFDLPVIVLSQLSRQVENREDKRPHLSDLRESGSIEQDADAVIFLYREQYYLEQEPPQQRAKETAAQFSEREFQYDAALTRCRNVLDVIVAKNRDAPVGTARLYCDLPTMTIDTLAEAESAQESLI